MNIITYGFLLLWLPLSLLIYWRLCHSANAKLACLFVVSYGLYAIAGLNFLPVLALLSLATYWLAQRKRFGLGIVLNLAALALFKYWDWGTDNANALLTTLNIPALIPTLQLALPLGISFYVFKHIGYLRDVQQNRYPATTDWLAFMTYSAFFPQINAGPISGFQDTGKQLRELPASISRTQIQHALIYVSMGLIKKLLIADQLFVVLQSGLFNLDTAGSGLAWAWMSVFLFALQIYFDFSGYTDLALGIGLLFGVTLPPNFDNPYRSTNPAQFWQRWHMSLSLWFRGYLFMPMSRALLKRLKPAQAPLAQYSANIVTMTLIGLWHGAGWGFVLWGLYHGLLLNFYAWVGRRWPAFGRRLSSAPLIFFVAVLVGWALFLSPNLAFASDLFRNMLGLNGLGSLSALWNLYGSNAYLTALVAIGMIVIGLPEAAALRDRVTPTQMFFLGIFSLIALLHLDRAIDFVYANF